MIDLQIHFVSPEAQNRPSSLCVLWKERISLHSEHMAYAIHPLTDSANYIWTAVLEERKGIPFNSKPWIAVELS